MVKPVAMVTVIGTAVLVVLIAAMSGVRDIVCANAHKPLVATCKALSWIP